MISNTIKFIKYDIFCHFFPMSVSSANLKLHNIDLKKNNRIRNYCVIYKYCWLSSYHKVCQVKELFVPCNSKGVIFSFYQNMYSIIKIEYILKDALLIFNLFGNWTLFRFISFYKIQIPHKLLIQLWETNWFNIFEWANQTRKHSKLQ